MRRPRIGLGLVAERDLRLLLAAQLLDAVAIGVAGVALPWLVLRGGHSPALAGLIYPLTLAPYVLFGLWAGSIGDARPWRRVMLVAHGAQALASAAVPLWAIADPTPPIALVLAAAFVVGTGRVFVDGAAFGAVAAVVGPADFVRGQSALSATWSLGLLAGPAIGGALVASIGAAPALAAESGALVLAVAAVWLVRGGAAAPAGAGPRDVRAGVRFIVRDRSVRAITLTNAGYGFATAGAVGLQIPLLRNELGVSSVAAGWILAAGALVGAVAALATGRITFRLGAGRVVLVATTVVGAGLLVLGLQSTVAVAALALATTTALGWLLATIFVAERQRRAPDELQSRVGMAGRMLMLAMLVAGASLASGLSEVVGVQHVYVLMGAGALIVSAVAAPALLAEARRT